MPKKRYSKTDTQIILILGDLRFNAMYGFIIKDLDKENVSSKYK